MPELLPLCRAANVAIFALVLTSYFVRSNDLWARLTFGLKLKRVGIGGVFLVLSVGSANAYLQHVKPTWPIPCLTAAGLAVLLGLWLSRHQHDPDH